MFGEDHVICPDLPMDPDGVIAKIATIVHENNEYPIVFVGTSLGGFYANYFSNRYDAPCVLVNPSTRPSQTMVARLGLNTNYATGEQFEVTDKHIALFAAMEYAIEQTQNGGLIDMFLANDDDVLDYELAIQNIPYTKSTTITPDGGHRYDQHWDLVMKKISEIV
jgi:predicted esterase YcpF (UPF0227 family)